MVRCKLQCTSITKHYDNYNQKQGSSIVKFTPVSGPENKTWSMWTPGGTFELMINNPEALNRFNIGETYFVDFSPAPYKESEE